MYEEFVRIREIINNENNKPIHYDALNNLITNFESKWAKKRGSVSYALWTKALRNHLSNLHQS